MLIVKKEMIIAELYFSCFLTRLKQSCRAEECPFQLFFTAQHVKLVALRFSCCVV